MAAQFSYLAHQALNAADRVARSFGGSQVQSDHLLLAMLMYRECSTTRVLEVLGFGYEDIGELYRVAEDGPQSGRGSGYSREAKRVLRRALARGEQRTGQVGTPDVLVALLEVGTGPAVRALVDRGVTVHAVRAELARRPAVPQGLASANPLPPEIALPGPGADRT